MSYKLNCVFRKTWQCFMARTRNVIPFHPFLSLNPRMVTDLALKCNRHRSPSQVWISYTGLLTFLGLAKEEKPARQQIIDVIKRSVIATQGGETHKAEQFLHVALRLAQDLQDSEAITFIYDMMANLALENGHYLKAETLFKNTAQRLFQKGIHEDDNAFLEISLKLASIYERTGRLMEAESGYEFCMKHLNQKVTVAQSKDEDTILLFAMCADAYGRYLMTITKYEEAVHYFSRALDACQQVLSKNHPQTLVLINNLGSAKGMMGKYEEAISHLKTAINVAKESESDDLITYYFNLAMLHLQVEQFSDATFYCNKALEKAPPEGELHRQAINCLKTVQGIREQQGAHN